jgi:hypothetical protein
MVQGRAVWVAGDLFQGKIKTVYGTNTPVLDAKGDPKREYGFGLAVPKSALAKAGPREPGEIWTAMHEEAYTLFPSRQIPPSFAMKYKDGDGVDQNGVPFASREGYAGHIVFACTTSLPIKFFRFENGQNVLVKDGIKCGDYVNVQMQIKAHPAQGAGKAGLYLNPLAVQLIGYGKEIVNAPSGDQIFGAQPPTAPPGASPTPLAPTEGFLVPQAAPQAFAQPQPHYGVLPAAHQPMAQMAAPPQMAQMPQPMAQAPMAAPQMPQPMAQMPDAAPAWPPR